MPNQLKRGTRRVGDFADGDAETPPTKVTLERSKRGISLTISWSERDNPYARWFFDDAFTTDDTSDRRDSRVPTRVHFSDSHGPVLLINCWARGFHANMLGPGSGTLWAEAAVLGPHELTEFDTPHGLATEISGLREWVGVTSWEETIERSTRGPVAKITCRSGLGGNASGRTAEPNSQPAPGRPATAPVRAA